MAKEIKSRVSKSLLETVQDHPNVERVHFDSRGNHYFNVHEYKFIPRSSGDKDRDAEINKRMAALNGRLYGRIHVQKLIDGNKRTIINSNPIENTEIVETIEREDLLNARPHSDLEINAAALAALSPEERKVIERMRAGKGALDKK